MAEPVVERKSLLMNVPSALVGAVLSFVEIVALCLPALGNRGPLIFDDTRSYYLGGRAVLNKASALIGLRATSIGGQSTEAAIQNALGVRSAFYSLLTYLSADTVSLGLVIFLQAALATLVLRLVFELLCPRQPRWRFTVFVVTLALATSLSWTVSFLVPDVFTSILALCLIVILLFWQQLSVGTRWALLATITMSVVMHLTNLPIAIGILLTGGLVRIGALWRERVRYAMIGAALGTGTVAMLAVGVIGFGQWTVAPQSPPFLLARSIEDGPGKLYLREHCPQVRLAMCRHLDRLDVSDDDFIWHANGVYSVVPPEERARIRAEEKRVAVAAALEHPWMQVVAIARNTLVQLVWFTLADFQIPSSADYTPTDMTFHLGGNFPPWQIGLTIAHYIAVLAGLGFTLHAWLNDRLTRDQRYFFILILATVVINAGCGAISLPAPRYEARVVWLIPMAALLFAYQGRDRRQLSLSMM